jgi:hypothetical protein
LQEDNIKNKYHKYKKLKINLGDMLWKIYM